MVCRRTRPSEGWFGAWKRNLHGCLPSMNPSALSPANRMAMCFTHGTPVIGGCAGNLSAAQADTVLIRQKWKLTASLGSCTIRTGFELNQSSQRFGPLNDSQGQVQIMKLR